MGFTHPDQGLNDGFLIRPGMTMGVLSSILQMFDNLSAVVASASHRPQASTCLVKVGSRAAR